MWHYRKAEPRQRRGQGSRNDIILRANEGGEIIPGFLIGRIEITSLLPLGKQSAVRILDTMIGQSALRFGLLLVQFLVAVHRSVLTGPLFNASHHTTIPHPQVLTEDHADIIELQPLTGVDAAHLLDRLL